MKPNPALRTFLLGSSFLASVNPVLAVDYYWDANAGSSGTGGNGIWNATSSLWRSGSSTGTLSLWPNTSPNADTARLAGTAGTVTLNSSSVNLNVNKIIVGTNGYAIAGPASGTAVLNLSGTTPAIDVTTGTTTVSAKITGSAGLSRIGTGTLILSGDNSGLSGGITSSGSGTLSLRHNQAAGTGTISFSSTQTGTAATFTLSDGVNIANHIILDAATGRNTINNLASSNTLSGNITINNDSSNFITFNNSASAGSGSTFTIGGATPNSTTITAADYSYVISFRATNDGELGILNSRIDAPNATFNINNQGLWTINSTGSDWAVTSLSVTGSRIKLGADDALATGARIDMNNGSSVDLNGFDQTAAGLGGTGTAARIRNDSASADSILTLSGLTADRVFVGGIVDGENGRKVSLVMNDSSGFSQTLSGANNTFSGATTVSAGTLYIDGALSNSAVTVETTGTIGGAGTLGSGLTIHAGANLDLTGATLSTNSAGILGLTGGSLTLGNLTFQDLVGWDWANAEAGTYELIDGAFSIDWGSTAYRSAATAYDFGNGRKGYFTSGSLNVVVIPEPRAALLGGLGLLALLRRRRN